MRLSVLRFTTLTALAGIAVGSGAPAAAQTPVELHTAIAAGAAPGQGRSGPGFALVGSVEAARADSRFGVRGELFYSRAARAEEGLFGVPCEACSAVFPIVGARSSQDAFGALVGATYGLTDAARIRPYLLGGVGLYRTRAELRGTLDTCSHEPGAACQLTITSVHDVERSTGVGVHTGLGAAFRVGQLDLTAEARYHLLRDAVGSGRLIPLTLGVRF